MQKLEEEKLSKVQTVSEYFKINFEIGQTYDQSLQIHQTVSDKLMQTKLLPQLIVNQLQIWQTLSAESIQPASNITENVMVPSDNLSMGILMVTDKNKTLVEYTMADMDNQLFVSKYLV